MKRFISIVLLGLMVLGVVSVYGQSAGPQLSSWDSQPPDRVAVQLNAQDSLKRWEERVYLHTDRERFSPGDRVFFKAYMVNNKTQLRWSPSGVLKLELRDTQNEVVSKQYHPLKEGISEGAFLLSDKLKDGTYRLMAYTRWMQNYGEDIFFTKTITVGPTEKADQPDENSKIASVRFAPEGGKLISGIPNRLVIYGTSSMGSPVSLEGDIIDDSPERIQTVNTYGKGMGQVTFTPMADKAYYLRLQDGRQFSLPEVQNAGYTLKINNLDPQNVFIQSEKRGADTTEKIFVQGHFDGKPCFENELVYNEEGVAKLEVSKTGLPLGKVDFQLIDEGGLILAERPIWITAPDQLDITIERVTPRSAKSERHAFKITVKDLNGQPVKTDLSMSARSNTVPEQRTPSSDAFYELNNGRKERFLQDLKVLSRSGDGVSRETYPEEIVYPFQKGLEIMGYAYDLKNELLVNKEIQLLGLSDSLWLAREVRTDATGLLRIRDLDFEGDTQIIFRAKGEDTRERLVKIVPLSETTINTKMKQEKRARKIKNLVLETTPWQAMDTTGLIELDPATVTGIKKQKQEFSTHYKTWISPQDVIVQDPARPRSLLEMINELPGINVVGIGSPNPRIQILRRGALANAGPPLWVVDGIPLFQGVSQDVPGSIFAQTAVGLVPALAIDRVEFLFGPPAAMYGTRAASGVFLIYTRDGADSDYIRRKEGQLKFKGFTPKPNIDQVLRQQLKRSKRKNTPYKTLFWNPNLQTDEQGQVIVQFDAPAHVEQLELHVESITARGLKGSEKLVLPTSR